MTLTSNCPPPLPPPPPPRTAEYGWNVRDAKEQQITIQKSEFTPTEQQHHQHQEAVETRPLPSRDYLLTVQFYPSSNQSGSIVPSGVPPSWEKLQIQVYEKMTPDVLALCVSQAVRAGSLLVGLFGEQDRIFHSFEYILSMADASSQVYCTTQPPPRIVHQEGRWHIMSPVMWAGAATGGLLLGYVGSHGSTYDLKVMLVLKDYVVNGFDHVHEWTFNLPFRELYRYGPYLIGWEGLALAEICNRITHFGGRDFWSRNLTECEAIYAGKEEAYLRTMRPISYTLLGMIGFWAVRHLVRVYGESKRNRTDRAVLEAYQAFQTLVRIASRKNGDDGTNNRMDRTR